MDHKQNEFKLDLKLEPVNRNGGGDRSSPWSKVSGSNYGIFDHVRFVVGFFG